VIQEKYGKKKRQEVSDYLSEIFVFININISLFFYKTFPIRTFLTTYATIRLGWKTQF